MPWFHNGIASMLTVLHILIATAGFAIATVATHAQTAVAGPYTINTNLSGMVQAAGLNAKTATIGSGVNGPQTAQFGANISVSKTGWFNGTAQVGEVDGLNINVRQGGTGSDASGILVNVQNTGHGFLSATEMVTSIVDPVANNITRMMDTQDGVLNAVSGDYDGKVFTAMIGALGNAILIQNNTGASWTNFIYASSNGIEKFLVDANGKIWTDAIPGASCHGAPTPNYTVTNGIVTHC